jgi:hypothetical protein
VGHKWDELPSFRDYTAGNLSSTLWEESSEVGYFLVTKPELSFESAGKVENIHLSGMNDDLA